MLSPIPFSKKPHPAPRITSASTDYAAYKKLLTSITDKIPRDDVLNKLLHQVEISLEIRNDVPNAIEHFTAVITHIIKNHPKINPPQIHLLRKAENPNSPPTTSKVSFIFEQQRFDLKVEPFSNISHNIAIYIDKIIDQITRIIETTVTLENYIKNLEKIISNLEDTRPFSEKALLSTILRTKQDELLILEAKLQSLGRFIVVEDIYNGMNVTKLSYAEFCALKVHMRDLLQKLNTPSLSDCGITPHIIELKKLLPNFKVDFSTSTGQNTPITLSCDSWLQKATITNEQAEQLKYDLNSPPTFRDAINVSALGRGGATAPPPSDQTSDESDDDEIIFLGQ